MAEPPHSFLCPISHLLMRDPVQTADGQTYDRPGIERWLRTHNTSPKTGAELEHKRLTPNFALKGAIEEWEKENQLLVRREDLVLEEPPIGRGTFKQVFRGRLRLAGAPASARVAVLKMRSEHGETDIKMLLKLGRHPRVVRILGQCLDGEDRLIVTEFAERGALSDAFESLEGQLTLPHMLAMMQQVCQGMEHLAEMGIVHGDLAARNALLFEFQADDARATSVKISDFGLSRGVYNRSYAVGAAGEARPTRWLAREVLQQNRFSEKSDVWAFAVLCWEILTVGMIPYYEVEEASVVQHVCDGGRPSRAHIAAAGNSCPDPLWDLMVSCWSASKSDRPTFKRLSVSLGTLDAAQEVQGHSPAAAAGRGPQASDVKS